MLGEFDTYRAAVERHAAACNLLERGGRPDLASRALSARAVFGRALGDRTAFRTAEDRLERLSRISGRADVRRRWLEEAAQNTTYVGDRTGGRELRLARIRAVAEAVGTEPPEVTPTTAGDVVGACTATGAHAARTSVGNAAFDIARSLYDQGLTGEPAVLAQARQWCDVAERAWPHATNGLVSLVVMRARLDATDAAARTSGDLVGTVLDAADRLVQISSRVSALVEVCTIARPRDGRVPGALLPAIDRAVPQDRGRLLTALAEWQLRSAGTVEEVDRARTWGESAAAVLRWDDDACLDPGAAARALLVVASAERRVDAPAGQELASLLRAASCLAVQLTTAVSARDRDLLGGLFAPALRRALDVAVRLGEPDAGG
ncbi:hypothetical protein ACWKWC_25020, partial [Geodermatophilus nigrescens]